MTPKANLPLILNLAYVGVNRGLDSDFKPRNGVTFCNQFIHFICTGMGYTDFSGMDANEMVSRMINPSNGWITVSDEVAQGHANEGCIVIAGHINPEGHGHLCLVLPGILELSTSYQKSVPKCANVGKDVFMGKKISFAFTPDEMPQYFCLAGMVS